MIHQYLTIINHDLPWFSYVFSHGSPCFCSPWGDFGRKAASMLAAAVDPRKDLVRQQRSRFESVPCGNPLETTRNPWENHGKSPINNGDLLKNRGHIWENHWWKLWIRGWSMIFFFCGKSTKGIYGEYALGLRNGFSRRPSWSIRPSACGASTSWSRWMQRRSRWRNWKRWRPGADGGHPTNHWGVW